VTIIVQLGSTLQFPLISILQYPQLKLSPIPNPIHFLHLLPIASVNTGFPLLSIHLDKSHLLQETLFCTPSGPQRVSPVKALLEGHSATSSQVFTWLQYGGQKQGLPGGAPGGSQAGSIRQWALHCGFPLASLDVG
jgi:hypothetical protein